MKVLSIVAATGRGESEKISLDMSEVDQITGEDYKVRDTMADARREEDIKKK